jgi:hypothetical protein
LEVETPTSLFNENIVLFILHLDFFNHQQKPEYSVNEVYSVTVVGSYVRNFSRQKRKVLSALCNPFLERKVEFLIVINKTKYDTKNNILRL